jgi:hypothetical protein
MKVNTHVEFFRSLSVPIPHIEHAYPSAAVKAVCSRDALSLSLRRALFALTASR